MHWAVDKVNLPVNLGIQHESEYAQYNIILSFFADSLVINRFSVTRIWHCNVIFVALLFWTAVTIRAN